MVKNLYASQLRVNGANEGAILEGIEDDKEYQISLSALYADGAQSEAVATRYSTCESRTHASWSLMKCSLQFYRHIIA